MKQTDLQSFVSEKDNIFQITFSAAPIGMALMHRDGRFQMVNPAFLEMLGYTEAEFLALSVADITHPDDIDQTRRLIGQLYAGELEGDRFQQEKRYLHKHGRMVWGALSVSLLRDAAGRPGYSMGQVIDITQSKREEAIRQGRTFLLERLASGAPLEQILTLLVENSQAVWPDSLGTVKVQDAQRNTLLYGACQSLSDFYARTTAPVAGDAGFDARAASVRETTPVVVMDLPSHPYWSDRHEAIKRAHPGTCWTQPIISSTGETLGSFEIYQRVPADPERTFVDYVASAAHLAGIAIERLRAENALRESEAKYRDLVETSQDLIWLVDKQGNWTFVNRSAAKTIYGYQPEEMLGRPFTDFVAFGSLQKDREAFAATRAGREPVRL